MITDQVSIQEHDRSIALRLRCAGAAGVIASVAPRSVAFFFRCADTGIRKLLSVIALSQEVDPERVAATFENGELTITLALAGA